MGGGGGLGAAAAASASAQTQTALGASLGSLAAIVLIGAVLIYFYYYVGHSRKAVERLKAQVLTKEPLSTIEPLRRQAWLENQRPFIQTNPLFKAQSKTFLGSGTKGEEPFIDLSHRRASHIAEPSVSSLTGSNVGIAPPGGFRHDSPFLRARFLKAYAASNSKAHPLKPQTSTFHFNNPLLIVDAPGARGEVSEHDSETQIEMSRP